MPDGAAGGPPAVEAPSIERVSVPSCPSGLSGASSSSVVGGAPDCRGSPSAVASCSGSVSSVASVCDSNVFDDNGLLIVKVSDDNSNVSGDPPISSVSNVPNADKESCVVNVNNSDNVSASASAGCSDSGVPLFGPAEGVASDSPPHRGTRR